MQELRASRDAGTATPDQLHELSRLQDTAAHTADVGGELIPGVLNARGRAQLEASGQMKPVRVKTDFDDFKDINDTLGHDVGDKALKLKAQAMRDAFGPGNSWREGWDEFGAHADTEEAAHAAMQQVRDKLANARLEGVDPKGNPIAERRLGVSYGTGRGSTHAEAAKAADNALLTDKAARKSAGLRSGRRASDEAGAVVSGLGARGKGEGGGDVPAGGQGQEVAVAEPETEAAKPPPTNPVETAASAEPVNPEGVSARNAAIDAQRDELGLAELPPAEREHWQDASDQARSGIANGEIHPRTLAAEVAAKPRALSTVETMALVHDLKSLTGERASAVSDALAARERGDTVAEAQALLRKEAALDAMKTNHAALRDGGTEAARSVSIRNAILKDDYTIGRNMDRAKLAYGDKFNDALRKQVETLSDELEKAQAEAARLQKAAESRQSARKAKANMTDEEKTQARILDQIGKLQKTIEERTRLCPI
jgi:diguanylate cyclase (GGDEF)-like protein